MTTPKRVWVVGGVFMSKMNKHKLSDCIKKICDMMKRNESDVRHIIVFEILAKTVLKFCLILFLTLANS